MQEIGLRSSPHSKSTIFSGLTDLALSDEEGNITSDFNDSDNEKPIALQTFFA